MEGCQSAGAILPLPNSPSPTPVEMQSHYWLALQSCAWIPQQISSTCTIYTPEARFSKVRELRAQKAEVQSPALWLHLLFCLCIFDMNRESLNTRTFKNTHHSVWGSKISGTWKKRAPESRFSKVQKRFRTRKGLAKSQTLWLQSSFIRYILTLKRGSLHTRSSRRVHQSVFKYRWSKNGFGEPNSFHGCRLQLQLNYKLHRLFCIYILKLQ